MEQIFIDNVVKQYGDFTAVGGLSLTIGEGEFVTLLGSSGSGKTTTLRMVAGFVQPDSGRIRIGESDVTHLPSNKRGTSMVFQNYALFPHYTVRENVAFGLQVRKVPKQELNQRVEEALQQVAIAPFADKYPNQLSGGQKQRVALARAIVVQPQVLLLDEPFGALDLKLRRQLQKEVRGIQQRLGITTLFVTHDQDEALSLSDRIVVMKDGRIVQQGAANEVYRRPKSLFVANFLGQSNLIPTRISSIGHDGLVTCAAEGQDQTYRVTAHEDGSTAGPQVGAKVLVGFRPESVVLDGSRPNQVKAVVQNVTYLGSVWSVELETVFGTGLCVDYPGTKPVPAVGDSVLCSWNPEDSFLLPEES